MSYIFFRICLAVKEPIPSALESSLPEIKKNIKKLKSFASKINEGNVNEEMTVRASYHICRHDEGLPCEPEVEI